MKIKNQPLLSVVLTLLIMTGAFIAAVGLTTQQSRIRRAPYATIHSRSDRMGVDYRSA